MTCSTMATFDCLKGQKELGDYLIVGVTADDFDKARGKINVQQSLMERIEAVRATGLADKIIVEEYEGQKIDDIRRYGVDIFTVGSDWKENSTISTSSARLYILTVQMASLVRSYALNSKA